MQKVPIEDNNGTAGKQKHTFERLAEKHQKHCSVWFCEEAANVDNLQHPTYEEKIEAPLIIRSLLKLQCFEKILKDLNDYEADYNWDAPVNV